jgi:hypothetical protein
MRFKQFLEQDQHYQEIWDYLSDPNNLPMVIGAAGAGTAALAKLGKWAGDKLTRPTKEAKALSRTFEDLELMVRQYGPDSEEVQRQLQHIQEMWPNMMNLAHGTVDQVSKDIAKSDGNILPIRSPLSARKAGSPEPDYRSHA